MAAVSAGVAWIMALLQGANVEPGTLFTGTNISIAGVVAATVYITSLHWKLKDMHRRISIIEDQNTRRREWDGHERRKHRDSES